MIFSLGKKNCNQKLLPERTLPVLKHTPWAKIKPLSWLHLCDSGRLAVAHKTSMKFCKQRLMEHKLLEIKQQLLPRTCLCTPTQEEQLGSIPKWGVWCGALQWRRGQRWLLWSVAFSERRDAWTAEMRSDVFHDAFNSIQTKHTLPLTKPQINESYHVCFKNGETASKKL